MTVFFARGPAKPYRCDRVQPVPSGRFPALDVVAEEGQSVDFSSTPEDSGVYRCWSLARDLVVGNQPTLRAPEEDWPPQRRASAVNCVVADDEYRRWSIGMVPDLYARINRILRLVNLVVADQERG
jgi:hypothetical protein